MAALNSSRTVAAVVSDGMGAIRFDILLSEKERALRNRIRSIVETEVTPVVTALYEKAEFDFDTLVSIAKKIGPAGLQIKAYGCAGWSWRETMIAAMEMARVDASFCTFYLVHSGLAMASINVAGTTEQKQFWLPRMAKYEVIGSFALTEPDFGSDATSLQTSARQVPGGWILNGKKRWIGNATFAHVIVVWARDQKTKQITGFLVERATKGLYTSKIENKMSLRIVQNADITLQDCFVPDSHHLSGAPNFQRGTQRVLESSRAIVAAAAAGVALGAYDEAVKYCSSRIQFGKTLLSFQLVQEKIMRALGIAQGCVLATMHLAKLLDEEMATMGIIALTKAWCTSNARQAVSLCRESVGGNGIILDYGVIKPFLDMESLHTYEGSYEINMLIAGRSITGISALL